MIFNKRETDVKGSSYLDVDNVLTEEGTLGLQVGNDGVYHECTTTLTEQEAIDLVCHIIKVFDVANSNIEVVHFAEGVDRAECLRRAADRIDSND